MIAALLLVAAPFNLRVAIDRAAAEVVVAQRLIAAAPDREPRPLPCVRAHADGERLLLDDRPWPAGTTLTPADGPTLQLELRSRAGRPAPSRRYRGAVALYPGTRGQLVVVNVVELEDYLRGVVPLEMGAGAPPAALEAQAIASRSYALARRGDGTRPQADFDVRNTQAYLGAGPEHPAADAAVAATAGRVLRVGDRMVEAVYHACCGGITAAPEEVWGGSSAGPRSVRCGRDAAPEPAALAAFLALPGGSFCDRHPGYRWQRRFAREELLGALTSRLGRRTGIGPVRDLELAARGPSGRVTEVLVRGAAGTTTVRGDAIRALFAAGGEALASTLFAMQETPDGWLLRGGGRGHGLGLCQAGAAGLAREGADVAAILRWYYPDAVVGGL